MPKVTLSSCFCLESYYLCIVSHFPLAPFSLIFSPPCHTSNTKWVHLFASIRIKQKSQSIIKTCLLSYLMYDLWDLLLVFYRCAPLISRESSLFRMRSRLWPVHKIMDCIHRGSSLWQWSNLKLLSNSTVCEICKLL